MNFTGTSGNDNLIGSAENDSLSGLRGNDYLDGKGGADTYIFNRGDGQDTLNDSSSDGSIDQLVFSGAGLTSTNVVVTRLGNSYDLQISFKGGISDSVVLKDQVFGSSNNYGVESVKFSDGVIWTEEQLWNAYLTQSAASNDTLEGTNANNNITGGLGKDYLDGRGGADTYLFNLGDGQDTLNDSSSDGSIDTLVFSGAGLTSTNAIVTRLGNSYDLQISFKGGISDSVVLKDQVFGSSNNYGVESVKFSDGVTWTEEQLWNAYLTQSAASNDTLEGTSANNNIRGGLGNDYLDGRSGADTYLFNRGDGQDTLNDSSSDGSIDKLVFSGTGLTAANAIVTRLGNSYDLQISFKDGISDSVVLKDQVFGSSNNYGVESVKFSDGVTWTEEQLWNAYLTQSAASNDTLEGTSANNNIKGGLGKDYLDGRSGADTYLFSRGDGQDTLNDSSSDSSIDKLVFSGTGLTAANAIVTRLGNSYDLQISFKDGISDSVVLKDQVFGSSNNYGVESVKFSDGVTWTEEQLWNAYLTQSAASNDTLEGTSANNTIRGGLGNDYLDGRSGADTYLFNRGDGQDTLNDSSSDSSIDRLVFSGAGLTAANAIVTRVPNSYDLKISFKGGISDSVVLKDQTFGSSNNYGVESVKFSDGVTWTEAQLWNASVTQTNQTLTGTNGNDNLAGGAGDDKLSGLEGNDTLRGGLGNDYLDGDKGTDTYLFQQGDGGDTIYDTGYSDTSIDQLVFTGPGLTSANAIVNRLGNSNDLQISFGGGISDSVVLKNQLLYSFSSTYGLESVKFSDGATWTEEQLWNAYLTTGAASNDTLEGTDANNTLRGGLGNDYLDGGKGTDTYLFQQGDGGDTIYDTGYSDTTIDQLVFTGPGLTSTNAIVTRLGSSNDLQISFGGGISDSVVLKNQLLYGFSSTYGLESIKFSDGVTWTEAQLWNAYLTSGATSNDTLEGTDARNTLRGGLGNDYLDGGKGADTYQFQQGDGGDTIYDTGYSDTSVDQLVFTEPGLTSTNAIVTRLGNSNDLQIAFGGGISDSVVLKNQLLYGFSSTYGIESIKFSDGVTWTEAQLWNAYLTSGATSNDTLEGTDANNTLRGGLGNDYLDGGKGADTYLFQQGDGGDTIYDTGYSDTSVDRLVFTGAGLTAANAIVTRLGNSNDLQIAFGNGISDSFVLKNQLLYGFSSTYGLESIKFGNGVTWTEGQLWNAYLTVGAASNDTLEGTDANNTLRGGLGNDYLDGGKGADTYLFQLGDGGDTIYDTGYSDTSVDKLAFTGAGLTSTNATVTRLGTSNDLQISFGSGISDSIVLKNQLYGGISSSYGVESITFSNGVSWTETQLWNAIG
jgi:Ca2+-binding RTX toxin-like protein